MKKPTPNGFTLIELLVVIAIIGLLAGIIILALGNARAKSRDAKRAADIRQMVNAEELYYNNYSGYPATLAAMSPTYMAIVPSAPTPPDGSCSTGQNAYVYTATGTAFTSPADGTTQVYPGYTITFCLGNITGSIPGGVHTASGSGIQ